MPLAANALIQVTPGLMIWTIVCFLITVFVLKRYAFGPIQAMIDERRRRIRQSIEEAESNAANAGKAIAFGLGIGLGSLGAGVGIGNIFGSMIQSVARQPELRGELQGIQWLGFALTEAVVFYGLVGGFLGFVLVSS